jgi:hypothetical protein
VYDGLLRFSWKKVIRMPTIDEAIFNISKTICKNIEMLSVSVPESGYNRAFASQNILSQLRNLVEYVAIKNLYPNDNSINPDIDEINQKARKYLKHECNLKFLKDFHMLLQKSVSHYAPGADGAERLMLKYYKYLLEIKDYLKRKYNLDVLENLEQFPLNQDNELEEYYCAIAELLESFETHSKRPDYNDRFYVQKVKPFFTNHKIYYEITCSVANTRTSKFDRVIVFSKQDVKSNYAIKMTLYKEQITILSKPMSIFVLGNWQVSIRPCELTNFAKIFGKSFQYKAKSLEYNNLMQWLTTSCNNLNDVVALPDEQYNNFKTAILKGAQTKYVIDILDQCRNIILSDCCGANILRYLLYNMNNAIILAQLSDTPCYKLSNLYLSYGCLPFENMPYCSSLIRHNPRIEDLLRSIPSEGHDCELLARRIRNNTEIEGKLFTNIDEVGDFANWQGLVGEYNEKLYYKHKDRSIRIFSRYLYIEQYANDCVEIIEALNNLATKKVNNYNSSVKNWIKNYGFNIDSVDQAKVTALLNMFENSRVAIIHGPAGTGKTTLMNWVAIFWRSFNKLFLANTHSAVENLKRRVNAPNCYFMTISKFILDSAKMGKFDILFIDECSTVSNADMNKILKMTQCQLVVLAGDTYQIESIYFGNWFGISTEFLPKSAIFELNNNFRTQNKLLMQAWDRVRNQDFSALELFIKGGYESEIDGSIFNKVEKDEIILCLNYDGLYGINNINRILQNNNLNRAVTWGVYTFKVHDPILFNETSRFEPLIHNNSKGWILDVAEDDQSIRFTVELDYSINELESAGYDFTLLPEVSEGHSVIQFSVNKMKSTDEDDNSALMPLQIAYAISIHKAQGLEYDSVKVVITKEVGERITQNIFYTAITRAKKSLKIYWSPETERSVFGNFRKKDFARDANILKEIPNYSNSLKKIH